MIQFLELIPDTNLKINPYEIYNIVGETLYRDSENGLKKRHLMTKVGTTYSLNRGYFTYECYDK